MVNDQTATIADEPEQPTNVTHTGIETFSEPPEEDTTMEDASLEASYSMSLLDKDWHFHHMSNDGKVQVVEAPCHPICGQATGGMMTAHALGFAHRTGSPSKTMTPAAVCIGCGIAKFLGPITEGHEN